MHSIFMQKFHRHVLYRNSCFAQLIFIILFSKMMPCDSLPFIDKQRLDEVAEILSDMKRMVEGSSHAGAPMYRDQPWQDEPTFPEKYLFEGDILLTVDQARSIYHHTLQSNIATGRKRSALISVEDTLWKDMPISYVYHQTLNRVQTTIIDEALAFWQSHTCVRFQQLPQSEGEIGGDVIVFYTGDGCFSMVGRVGGSQSISVGSQCTKMGLVAHEIGHALGLWHEQSRPDSQCCVKIITENIQSGYRINFQQRPWKETQTYGLPYDLGSVMHYRSTAFSRDENQHTIETVEPGYQRTIGQRKWPSFIDVQVINKAYCSNVCREPLECQYGGYVHPKTCNACLCPDGLGGTYCERTADPQNAACGGIIYLTSYWTEISSPNYPNPYGYNQKCSWLFRAQTGGRVRLEFLDTFDVSCNLVTCSDYVEIKIDGSQFSKTGMRYCCGDAPTTPIYSYYNEMLVVFNSEQVVKNNHGFRAKVTQYLYG